VAESAANQGAAKAGLVDLWEPVPEEMAAPTRTEADRVDQAQAAKAERSGRVAVLVAPQVLVEARPAHREATARADNLA
jgi:hypothetical protein